MRDGWKPIMMAVLVLVLASFPAWPRDVCSTPVATESGLVSGAIDDATMTCVWKGIPYAAPPTGELRFRAPEYAPSWEGEREALEYGPKCMQVFTAKGTSEDCLYLNVWRPMKSGRFPVMVWIHGGGYVMGAGSEGAGAGAYNGARLSEFGDVVVVTINYRLHAFGFLADPALRDEDPNQSVGNYGSLDQVAAIRWVSENIAGFGGDPGAVTIFGESAGGWSVCTMLATPLNRGRIHRAILESGGCEKTEDLEAGYLKGEAIARRVGCVPGDLGCLRAVPAEKLIGGLLTLYRQGMSYSPHHDGYLLSDPPLELIRSGQHNRVPFLAGFNRNEVDAVLIARPGLWNAPPCRYERVLADKLSIGDREARELAALYPLSEFEGRPRKAFGKIFTDASLACPTYLGLSSAAAFQDDVYLYRFDYDDMKFGARIGALHSMEVPFVFNSIENGGRGLYDQTNLDPALELSRIIQGYWTNFARTGDPNGPGLPPWPKYRDPDPALQVLDVDVFSEPARMQDRCAFWDEYYDLGHKGFEENLGRRADR